jgi:hypothetical protein
MDPQVLSVAEFCSAYSISRAQFYRLLDEDLAPACFFVGRRRLISQEAAQKWRVKMEARSAPHAEGAGK